MPCVPGDITWPECCQPSDPSWPDCRNSLDVGNESMSSIMSDLTFEFEVDMADEDKDPETENKDDFEFIGEVLAVKGKDATLTLPQKEKDEPNCFKTCQELRRERNKRCAIFRKRVALAMKKAGCPSTIKGVKQKRCS